MFGLFEIRQDRGEGPAGIAELFPVVEIAGGSANVNHGVDSTGTAEDFAAGPVETAILKLRLGFGGIIPVHGGFEEFGEGGGDGDLAGARRAAGFEKQDADVGVFGKASSENATRGASTDNDVIVFGVGGSGHVGLGFRRRYLRTDYSGNRAGPYNYERRVVGSVAATGSSLYGIVRLCSESKQLHRRGW